MIIFNEAHYVASNITFFLKNTEIVCSIDKYQLPPFRFVNFVLNVIRDLCRNFVLNVIRDLCCCKRIV